MVQDDTQEMDSVEGVETLEVTLRPPKKRAGRKPRAAKAVAHLDTVKLDEPAVGDECAPPTACLGDHVTFWLQEGDTLVPRNAFLDQYSKFSKTWGIVMQSGPAWIPYQGIPYSPTPKQAHWTFRDQLTPIAVTVG